MPYTSKQISATIDYLSNLILSAECENKTRRWLENQLGNLINSHVRKNYPSIKLGLGQPDLQELLPLLRDRSLSFPADHTILLKISGESLVLTQTEQRTIYSNTQRKSRDEIIDDVTLHVRKMKF